MCLNIGIPKSISFPFGTNGKLIDLGVPILVHIIIYEEITYLLLCKTSLLLYNYREDNLESDKICIKQSTDYGISFNGMPYKFYVH